MFVVFVVLFLVSLVAGLLLGMLSNIAIVVVYYLGQAKTAGMEIPAQAWQSLASQALSIPGQRRTLVEFYTWLHRRAHVVLRDAAGFIVHRSHDEPRRRLVPV